MASGNPIKETFTSDLIISATSLKTALGAGNGSIGDVLNITDSLSPAAGTPSICYPFTTAAGNRNAGFNVRDIPRITGLGVYLNIGGAERLYTLDNLNKNCEGLLIDLQWWTADASGTLLDPLLLDNFGQELPYIFRATSLNQMFDYDLFLDAAAKRANFVKDKSVKSTALTVQLTEQAFWDGAKFGTNFLHTSDALDAIMKDQPLTGWVMLEVEHSFPMAETYQAPEPCEGG